MKNQLVLSVVVAAAITLTMSACGKDASGSGSLNKQSGNATDKTACGDFSGSYELNGFASLVLKQTNCDNIQYTQTCQASADFCSAFGILNIDYNLPLNGTANSAGYSANLTNGVLTVTQVAGNTTTAQAFTSSAHPCDPSNPTAGLEANVTSTQNSDGGALSITSCQPWSRQ